MFKYINKLFDKIKKSEKGQGMVEYALIIAFVAAIAIYALNGRLGNAVKTSFDNAESGVRSAADIANKDLSGSGGT